MKHSKSIFRLGVAFAAALCVSGLAGAADKSTMRSRLPAKKPVASAPVSAPALGTPGKANTLARKAAKPLSADELIDGMSAVVKTRDGKERVFELPKKLQMKLKAPKATMAPAPFAKPGKFSRVTDTGEFPYSTIGVLASGCSGVLIAKHFVLTAGWCVWDANNKKFYDNLDFYPGINGEKQPFGTAKWKQVWAPKGFTEKGQNQFNYALVELEGSPGDKTGWFAASHFDNFNFKELNTGGYQIGVTKEFSQWQTGCAVEGAETDFIFYKCSGKGKSLAAMTGGPIWWKGKGEQDWHVVGIHSWGQDDSLKAFWGTRISGPVVETLNAWIAEADQAGGGGGEEEDEGGEDGGGEDDGGNQGCECPDDGGGQNGGGGGGENDDGATEDEE